MATAELALWLHAIRETVASYRRMIDATIAQLTDTELSARPAHDVNSVAIMLRHLGGNLRSRWTDFLTTDGEKPDRDRDNGSPGRMALVNDRAGSICRSQ